MAAWESGKRHESCASNTIIAAVGTFVLLVLTVAVDTLNGQEPPPTYLTGLLGLAGGALFGAVGSDKTKRETEIARDVQTTKNRTLDVNETAIRAEYKADQLAEFAKQQHPHRADEIEESLPPPLIEGGEG